jgi:glycosyltransferase involved in cell wall biosynthesis
MEKEPEPAAAGALPTVSVVIPCYNYGRYLRECVSSALSQDEVEVRVLVIDDASTDGSFQVAAQLAAEDRRVSARRHEINRGHIATYNEGLVWAEGAYTVLISADDLLAPGSLRRATALMEAHPNVGFVYGGNVRFRSGEQLSGSWRFPHPPSFEIHPGREWLAATCKAGRNPISAPEVVVRTELQQRLGGYCAELPHAGDLEMWMRFAAHADVGLFRNVLHAYVRDHDSNMQRTRFASQLSRLAQRQAAFDHAFSRYGDRTDPTGRLRRVADRNVRADALWWMLHCLYRRELQAAQLGGLLRLALGVDGEARGSGGPPARHVRRVAVGSLALPSLLLRGVRRARQDRAEPGQPPRFVAAIAVRRPISA